MCKRVQQEMTVPGAAVLHFRSPHNAPEHYSCALGGSKRCVMPRTRHASDSRCPPVRIKQLLSRFSNNQGVSSEPQITKSDSSNDTHGWSPSAPCRPVDVQLAGEACFWQETLA